MLKEHECMAWPWTLREDQQSDADRIFAQIREDMKAEMVRCREVPDEYEWDVLTLGRPVKMGKDCVIEGVGTVPADVVLAGLVLAWRKGTTKPKIQGGGRMG